MSGTEVEPEMVQRLLHEGAAPIARAAALLPPSRGKARHATTLARWIEQGKRGVRLEGFVGPGKGWWTSTAALGRFFAELTTQRLAGRRGPPSSPAADERAKADVEKRASAAAEALKRLGRKRK